eukprot:CAMPEP_0170286142 /NCGR_PEP_ID=MMETSP0116_2-20130129/43125_1 /TAXON_ID=400756 /ORGANISM="Durinskia baltica, Strain CSIRO CS-38" /LENGTH=69 /DNA_ID=CAMNT_0010537553 /DNA_START=22 /DNA_END=232 /DNA_ORIENTATION=+
MTKLQRAPGARPQRAIASADSAWGMQTAAGLHVPTFARLSPALGSNLAERQGDDLLDAMSCGRLEEPPG